MSIDELARDAAAEARRHAVQRVDTGSMLEQLQRTRRMRGIASTVSVLVLITVLLLGGGLMARQYDSTNSGLTPGARPTPTPSTASSPSSVGCGDEVVTCLGGDRYRVALVAPVTITVPGDFDTHFSVPDATWMEIYRKDFPSVGVTVLENPVPVRNDDSWSRDVSAGSTAESQATWLANRPFLAHTSITRTIVGGRTAWRVTGALRPGAKLVAWKETHFAAPTFALSTSTAGYWPGLVSDYTFIDAPNSGVTVIWSWAQNEHSRVLEANWGLIASLSFGP